MGYSITNRNTFQFQPLNAESQIPKKIYGFNKLKQEGVSAAQHVSNSGIKPTTSDPETAKPIKNHETAITTTSDLIKSVKKSLNKISFSPAQQKVSKTKAVALIVCGLALGALAFTGIGAPIALGLVLGGLFLMGAGFHMKDEINTTNKGIAAHNKDITTFPKDPPISSKMKFHADIDPSIKEKLVDLTKNQVRLKHAQNFLKYLITPENRDKNFKEQLLTYNNSLCDFLGDEACKAIDICKLKLTDRTEMNRAFKNIQKFVEFQKDSIDIDLNLLEDAVLGIENNKADQNEKAERLEKKAEKFKQTEVELRAEFFEVIENNILENIESQIATPKEKQTLLNLLKSCRNNENMDVSTACEKMLVELRKQIEERGIRAADSWQHNLDNTIRFTFDQYSDLIAAAKEIIYADEK